MNKIKEIKELLVINDLVNSYEVNEKISLTKKARFSFARYLDQLMIRAGDYEQRELAKFADYLLNNDQYLKKLAAPEEKIHYSDLEKDTMELFEKTTKKINRRKQNG